jgi:AcrR family transcriptional regulator
MKTRTNPTLSAGEDVRPKSEETRQKLIEAAGEIFAQLGYEAASVRQITEKAHVNIAAINYYFGDKHQLYRTVLETITLRVLNSLKAECRTGTPEERLRQFIRSVLRAESDAGYAWAHLLMAREINRLRDAQPEILTDLVRPLHAMAEAIVRDLMGVEASEDVVRLAASLLVSVSFNWLPQQRLDQQLYPGVDDSTIDFETTVERIHLFALGGVRGLAGRSAP